MITDTARDTRRLGRAIAYLHQQDTGRIPPLVAADIETLLLTGRAMDFAARIHGHKVSLTDALVKQYARQAGIGPRQLIDVLLPSLRSADVLDYSISGDDVTGLEEFVGLTGTLLDQTVKVLRALHPSQAEMAVLHSVEIASWAPLTRSQHLGQLHQRGYSDLVAESGLRHSLAAGVNQAIPSTELREDVIFNPYVWGSGQVKVAAFLKSLPPAERDSLVGICEEASNRPGLALPSLAGSTPNMVASARKVGLLQASTVRSSASGASQTYVFSPLLEADDDKLLTTEALHQRKLFVAHILFGHEKAMAGGGRIMDPVVLVNALLSRGSVGPASNIATDYHLLERHGIVQVEESGSGRAYLKMIKPEIVAGGLDWLRRTGGDGIAGEPVVKLLRSPGSFVTPEEDRHQLGDLGESDEIARASVLKLREELQRAARQDNPL